MSVLTDNDTARQVIVQNDLETHPIRPTITEYTLPVSNPILLTGQTSVVFRIAESGESIDLPRLLRVVLGRRVLGKEHLVQLDLSPHCAYDMGVSRLHAVLYRKTNDLFLQDLESLNGTFVNGRRLPPGQLQPLYAGDELLFARLRCYVEIH